jgi:hypothetical protein
VLNAQHYEHSFQISQIIALRESVTYTKKEKKSSELDCEDIRGRIWTQFVLNVRGAMVKTFLVGNFLIAINL